MNHAEVPLSSLCTTATIIVHTNIPLAISFFQFTFFLTDQVSKRDYFVYIAMLFLTKGLAGFDLYAKGTFSSRSY